MTKSLRNYSAYSHAIETKSQTEQIIMLYDASISYIKQAREAFIKQEHNDHYKLIEQVISIFHGLRACVDFSKTPEVAGALDEHYKSIENILIDEHINPSTLNCDKLIENLEIIRNSWQEILDSSIPAIRNDSLISQSDKNDDIYDIIA